MRKANQEAFYDSSLDTWARYGNGGILIGITDWAQSMIGNVISIHELPKCGDQLMQNMLLCEMESNKTTTEILMPIGGQVSAINHMISLSPNLINEDCYEMGWLLKVMPSDTSQLDQMLTAHQYERAIGSFFKKSQS